MQNEERPVDAGADDPGARYVYCVSSTGHAFEPGWAPESGGLDGQPVYLIPYRDLCAMVHRCPPRPYQSGDQEQVCAWVEAHQRVIDEAIKQFNVAVPMTFDTILYRDDIDPDGAVVLWLAEAYPKLREKLTHLQGRFEYGVEVLLRVDEVTEDRLRHSPELGAILAQMAGKPPAVAYLLGQKLQKAIASEIDRCAQSTFKDFYAPIRAVADEIRVERAKQTTPETAVVMNVSCLLPKRK